MKPLLIFVFTAFIVFQGLGQKFTAKERRLIKSASDETPMRVFLINNYQDSVLLRTPSGYINPKAKHLEKFTQRLYSTVRDSITLGVGIAAPQVGILKNIIWVQRFDKQDLPFEVYLNPKITQYSTQKQDCPEGCLSIPNRREITKSRALTIDLEYDNLKGEHLQEKVSGFTAVIFQHEIDHLNGILFIDHLKEETSKR